MIKLISHNQGVCVAIIGVIAVLVWNFGCQSRVESLVSDKQITRGELAIELEAELSRLESELNNLQKQAELKFIELDRQDEVKRILSESATLIATTGEINTTGVITLLTSLIGIGAIIDNRIKDKVIKNRPLSNNTT